MYTTNDVLNKYKARLNKSDSGEYDNIWLYQVEETFNKGILEWIRKQKRGKNLTLEGDEETRDRIDDLQVLLKSKLIAISNYPIYADTERFPEDYLYQKRITPYVTKGNCKRRRISSYLREEANVDGLLSDWDSQPSFDFEETFHTTMDNKARIYHNKDFVIEEALLTYYRRPRFITFSRNRPQTLEFKDDVSEQMIDEGIKIMAADLGLLNEAVILENRIEKTN